MLTARAICSLSQNGVIGKVVIRQQECRRSDRTNLGLGGRITITTLIAAVVKVFSRLIGLLERLGFTCRERFYGGAEAGWGAQVLEQAHAGIVIFADVDLSPDEVTGDFAHEGLAARDELGTVGLWCKLHGEAIMAAGMHHLECQFDFDAARAQLADAGIETMKPFTDFEYLKQAFTVGEVWGLIQDGLNHCVKRDRSTMSNATSFWSMVR